MNFCPRFFGNVGKWFDLKIYDLTDLETNNCNTHNVQYFMKLSQPDNENWSVNSTRNMFLEKSCKRCTGESSPRRFYSQTCLLQAPCNSWQFLVEPAESQSSSYRKTDTFIADTIFFWHRVKCSRQIYICLADKPYLLW